MKDLRKTLYTLAAKMPPIGPIRIIQKQILRTMRRDLEIQMQELTQIRRQAIQLYADVKKEIDDPNCSPEKKEKFREIDKMMEEATKEYLRLVRLQISEE